MSDTGNRPKSFLRTTNNSAIADVDERFEFGSWEAIDEMSFVNEVLGIARSSIKSEIRSQAYRHYIPKITNQRNIPDEPLYLQLYTWGGETHYADWARVRKFTSPSPAVTIELQPLPPQPCRASASVNLHGEKTDVVLGEDILFKIQCQILYKSRFQDLKHHETVRDSRRYINRDKNSKKGA